VPLLRVSKLKRTHQLFLAPRGKDPIATVCRRRQVRYKPDSKRAEPVWGVCQSGFLRAKPQGVGRGVGGGGGESAGVQGAGDAAVGTLLPRLTSRGARLEVDGTRRLKPAVPPTSANVLRILRGLAGPPEQPTDLLHPRNVHRAWVHVPAHSSCLLRAFSRGCLLLVTSPHSPESS